MGKLLLLVLSTACVFACVHAGEDMVVEGSSSPAAPVREGTPEKTPTVKVDTSSKGDTKAPAETEATKLPAKTETTKVGPMTGQGSTKAATTTPQPGNSTGSPVGNITEPIGNPRG